MVEVEHEGVGAFDEYSVVVFVFLEEGELIDDVWLEFLAVFLFLNVRLAHLVYGLGDIP